MTDLEYRREAHKLVVHPDGSHCEDGCDAGPAWCQCEHIPGAVRLLGWLVCMACDRVIH